MSNDDLENDDFENDGFDNFDDDNGSSNTLGELVQSNPLIKVGIVLAAAALIFGIIILFGGKKENPTVSNLAKAPDLTQAPGTEDASLAYIEAIQDVNQQNLERAQQNQESAIPIPIEPPVGRIELTQEEQETEDPLQRWRRLQEERLQREMESRQVIEPAVAQQDNGRAEAVSALAKALSSQMQSILSMQGKYTIQQVQVSSIKEEGKDGEGEDGEGEEDGTGVANTPEIIVVPAGEIAYAQLITEANSDVPGPVLAEIMSGPLAGSRILGTFSRQDEYLTIRFDKAIVDGVTVPINAIALDPATTLTGLATEVDHRYLQRIVLPTAAAFVEGAANVIADSGRTDVTVSGDIVVQETTEADVREEIAGGIEEAGEQLGEILDEMNDDIEPLVIVATGTPMGLLFLQEVTRPATAEDF
jgi:intracellular multiplication protein IcmE